MAMTAEFSLARPPALGLAPAEEIALLEGAAARGALSLAQTKRLASLLHLASKFEQAIALYQALEISDQPDALMRHGDAHLALQSPADTDRASGLFEQALRSRPSDRQRAALYMRMADIEQSRGRAEAARGWTDKAVRLRPEDTGLLQRLAKMDVAAGNARAVLEYGETALARDPGKTGAISIIILALTALGRHDDARALMGWDPFAHYGIIAPPAGWDSLEAFNTALAAELTAHPARLFSRPRAASRNTWRVDAPLLLRSALLPHFCDLVEREVRAYLARLPLHDHPFVAARPAAASLNFWAVTTEGDGHEQWHTHPAGWLSGVYYVAVPDAVANGDTDAGCIEFGVPSEWIGDAAAPPIERTLLRPQPGLMVLFPSYIHHRTFPHGSGTRICIAFDINPAAAVPR